VGDRDERAELADLHDKESLSYYAFFILDLHRAPRHGRPRRNHMDPSDLTRRRVLLGIGAGALALPGLPRRVLAAPAREVSALAIVYLNGGPAGLFNSAGSFLRSGAFGVTHDNVRDVGNGLLVDAATFGALPAPALAHMASINFKHGYDRHDFARAALLQSGSRSNLLLLAQAFPDPAPIRCAVVNTLGLPDGVDRTPPPEAGIGLGRVAEFDEIGLVGVAPAAAAEVRAAYGVPATGNMIGDAATSLCAAELLLRTGTSVVFTQPMFAGRPDRQLDTHRDDRGAEARKLFGSILAPLRTFVARTLALRDKNVVIVLVGEFSRTTGASDHEPGGTATVIGKYVKTGTAGPQTDTGAPPAGSPPPAGLWAYLASVLKIADHPFGANPSPELVIAA
jgi:hypothetical protein